MIKTVMIFTLRFFIHISNSAFFFKKKVLNLRTLYVSLFYLTQFFIFIYYYYYWIFYYYYCFIIIPSLTQMHAKQPSLPSIQHLLPDDVSKYSQSYCCYCFIAKLIVLVYYRAGSFINITITTPLRSPQHKKHKQSSNRTSKLVNTWSSHHNRYLNTATADSALDE